MQTELYGTDVEVSTHSRLKAAGTFWPVTNCLKKKFQHTAA